MTQVTTPSNLLGVNEQHEFLLDNQEYKLEREGDGFFVRTRPLGGDYGPPKQVVLLTGSHNLQIVWLETSEDRTLEQFPFAYIIAEKIWAPVRQTFLMPPDLKEYYSIGAWNGACMDCHVTGGQSRFVTGNKWDSRVAEFGIACEACHSEGRQHIALNRNPFRRFKIHLTTKSDATVTNPARLGAPVSGLDCGQCHSVWAFNNISDKINFNRQGGNFRPGHDELGQRFVVQPSAPDHREQKDFIRETEPDFFSNRFLGRWDDPRHRSRVQRPASVALFPGRKFFLHILSRDAPGQHAAGESNKMGAQRSVASENGFGRSVFTMPQSDWLWHQRAYAPCDRFFGQSLLQLPHAEHDFWSVARDAFTPSFPADRAGECRLWPTKRLQSLSPQSNPRLDGRKITRLVQSADTATFR